MNKLHHLWFKLTCNSRCSWCGRLKHRAPLNFLFKHKVTHGICRECCEGITK
jgi:hypothetical protein